MPKVFITNKGELTALFSGLAQSNEYPLNINYSKVGNRSLSQNSLFHMWMDELAKYSRQTNADAPDQGGYKLIMKHSFLGYETKIALDCVTGLVTEISQLRRTRDLSTGEMFHFMELVDRWCISIGLMLTTPDNSEYKKLKDEGQ